MTIPVPDGGGELRDVDTISASNAWAVGCLTSQTSDRIHSPNSGMAPPGPRLSPSRSAQNYLLAVKAFSANDAWAVGQQQRSNSLNFETLLLHWDGVNWAIVPTLIPIRSRITCSPWMESPPMTFGPLDTPILVRRPAVPFATHWNGVEWTVTPIPSERDATLEGVVALAPEDVWAVGSTFSIQLFWEVPYALHWNGTSWRKV